jgi:DNA-binding NtrC family response regulator
MRHPAIVIMEQDACLCRSLRGILLRQGCTVIEATDLTELLQSLQSEQIALVIIGAIREGAGQPLDIVRCIRCFDKQVPLIVIAADSTEELAIAALKAGVNDYFKRPFALNELAASLSRWLAEPAPAEPVSQFARSSASASGAATMLGDSSTMQEIRVDLLRAAAMKSNVLITGETGTGKEMAAEFIHAHSPRSRKPLIGINCAAIPDGLLESELFGHVRGAFTGATVLKKGQFELAHQGTLFLDEIGDMSLCAQAKILRAIERKEILQLGGKTRIPLDLRIIAATNQDVEQLVEEKKLREDLYYRLNVIRVHLPPLRERQEDVPALLDYYLKQSSRRLGREAAGFSQEALEHLLQYHWPGNVRELKNLVEAACAAQPFHQIALQDLPESFRKRLGLTTAPLPNERERLLSALSAVNWNKSKAAQQLSWSRMTLYRKMAKYHISDKEHHE